MGTVATRTLRAGDVDAVVAIDAHHTGATKPSYWTRVFRDFLEANDVPRIGLGAEDGDALVGFLFGEARAFEFGSDRCGWIFAVGVAPSHLHRGVASSLLEEACRQFRATGLGTVRTMVRRNDVPVLSFFRSNGFRGGTFVQLERPSESEV